jgi:DNA-binding NtrC family response regulator
MSKVLIVDDDVTSRSLVKQIVSKMQLGTIQASSVSNAICVLEDNLDVDLIILDYQMPEQSGEALLHHIRASGDKRLTTIPVIMVSGIVGLKEIEHLLKRGVSRFLPKPINVGMLKEYISDLAKSETEAKSAELRH